MAQQLRNNPELFEGQVALLKATFPNASDEAARNLVSKVIEPNFNIEAIQNDLEALIS